MQPLKDKVVLITGASAGIGRACAEQFAAFGAKLVLTARRESLLAELAKELQTKHQVEVLVEHLDVSDQVQVSRFIKNLPQKWQSIDILLNNAGLALGLEKIQDGTAEDWDRMIDTNVKGVLYMTKAVLPSMLARNSGHIINIGSISAYEVYSGGVAYCATKFALRALSDGTKMDVHGSAIRVSEVDPGMVDTEFSVTRFKGDQKRADSVYQGTGNLSADDIADAVIYCATRPKHVDVRVIKIYPTDQTATHMLRRDDQ